MQVAIDAVFGPIAFNEAGERAGGAVSIEGGEVGGDDMNALAVGLQISLGVLQRSLQPLCLSLEHLGQVGGAVAIFSGGHSPWGLDKLPQAGA